MTQQPHWFCRKLNGLVPFYSKCIISNQLLGKWIWWRITGAITTKWLEHSSHTSQGTGAPASLDHPTAASWNPWEPVLQARCLCLNFLLAQVFLMNSNLPPKPVGMGRYWCSVSNKHMAYLSQVSHLLKVYLAQSPKVTPLPWLSGKYFSLYLFSMRSSL